MLRATRCTLLLLCLAAASFLPVGGSGAGASAAPAEAPAVTLADWVVRLPAPGFKQKSENSSADWKSRVFGDASGRIEVAVNLRRRDEADPAHKRTERWAALAKSEPPKTAERTWEQDGHAFLEYLIEDPTSGIRTKVVHGFSVQEELAVETRVTQRGFRKANQAGIEKLIRAVRIEPQGAKSPRRG